MAKGQVQETVVTFDNPLLGKVELQSDNDNTFIISFSLVFATIIFYIYSKYWHRPLLEKAKKLRRKK